MKRFILIRILKGFIGVLFIWTLIFVVVRVTGDPVSSMLDEFATNEQREQLTAYLGLDLPIWEQYVRSINMIFKGDMGRSYYYRRDVADLFTERLGATLLLGVPAFILSAVLGLIIGSTAAYRRDTIYDRATMASAVFLHTIPSFVLGIVMILVFSLWLRILPSGRSGTLQHMIMPIIAMVAGPLSSISRLSRSAMLDTLGREFLDGARMKGLRENVVIVKHALRASLIPVVTQMGMQLGTIIGGAMVAETVFAWPGVGTLMVEAAKQRDFPTLQFGVLLIACTVTIANILVDISYGFLDPRIRDSFK